MENTLTKTFHVVPSQCDSTARLGIPNTFSMLMDVATEHADHLGIGPAYLFRENRFWLTVNGAQEGISIALISTILAL